MDQVWYTHEDIAHEAIAQETIAHEAILHEDMVIEAIAKKLCVVRLGIIHFLIHCHLRSETL